MIFLKKLKDNWELINIPHFGRKENLFRIFQTLKIQIQSLLKENEKLNKNNFELKKSDRMNFVYKNIISKFEHQIESSRKYFYFLNIKN